VASGIGILIAPDEKTAVVGVDIVLVIVKGISEPVQIVADGGLTFTI
jgi:hypothetical protein